VQLPAAKLRQGPWLSLGAVMGRGGMWTAEALAADLLPLFHQLGFRPPPGLSLMLNSGLPPSASVSPGADCTRGVQYATSDTNEHAFSAPPGEGLWEGE
jgi:hypothetical protein